LQNNQIFITVNSSPTSIRDFFIMYDKNVSYYAYHIGAVYNFRQNNRISYYLGLNLTNVFVDEQKFDKINILPWPKAGLKYNF
jgi:hypothetical protein